MPPPPPPSASLTVGGGGEKGGDGGAAATCGAGGSSAAERKQHHHNSSLGYRPESFDFPSHLFHECFRKGFVLELDRLCGLAWEISRMDDDEAAEKKEEEKSWERKIEALHLRWNKFADLYSEHTKCEDATMFPELNVRVANVTKSYELEHEAEEWLFEEVGGLVNTVWKETKEMMDGGKKALERRSIEGEGKDAKNDFDFGKRESVKLALAKAARGLHATRTTLKAHLAKESAHLLPLLKKHFSEDEQAKLIWSFLEKFPTEKVTGILEWVFREMMMMMREDEREYYLESLEMYLRTPQVKTCAEAMALKSKLKKWIEDEANDEERERMRKKVEKAPILSLLFEKEGEENNNENVEMTAPQQRTNHPPSEATNALKRNRGRNRSRQKQKKKLPIDHIFQFHDALRVELNRMEAEFLKLPTDGASCSDAKLVREIEGRFVFLQGVYAAHSKSEDEVVFPQLEKKKALVNVSHSYTLDHEQESELFEEMLSLIEKLKKHIEREILKEEERMMTKKNKKKKKVKEKTTKVVVNKKTSTRSISGEKNEQEEVEVEVEEDDSGTIVRKLQETCVALKVSLETHVKTEEDELWPIFEEHFTIEEQEELVGLIIGQTGAEVLRAMLDWVRRSLDSEEALEMMANMKQATENTRFAKWLNTWMTGEDPEAVKVLGLKKRATTREKQEEKGEKRRKIYDTNDVNKKPSGGVRAAKKREEEKEKEKRRQQQQQQQQQQHQQQQQNNERQPDDDEISDATTATNTRILDGHGVRQVNEYFDTLRKSQSADKLLSTSTSIDNQSEGDDTSKDTNSNHTDTGIFKPGWSDIFKMNQRQLESALYILNRDDTLAPSRKAYLMQNLLASRWITGNQKITEDKMELDAMMVDGGSKNTTNKKNIETASASAEHDSSNTGDEKKERKNISPPTLKGSPNFKLHGSGGGASSFTANSNKKKLRDATNQPIVCYACPPSENTGTPTTPSSFDENVYIHDNCLGCKHYHRKCKIVAACCNVPFTCRF